MLFSEFELNVLYRLFVDYLYMRDIVPIKELLSKMDMRKMHDRIYIPFLPIKSLSFLGFIWSQEQLIKHPNFQHSMIAFIQEILKQMEKQKLDDCAFHTVLNFDCHNDHYIYIALQHRQWDFIHFMGEVCQEYFNKNKVYKSLYVEHLKAFNHAFPHILSIFIREDVDCFANCLSHTLPILFSSLHEFDNFITRNLGGKLLGKWIFLNYNLAHHTKDNLVYLILKLISPNLLDMKFIDKHFLEAHEQQVRILDQIILTSEDNPLMLQHYLRFIEQLYIRQLISREKFVDLILNHMRKGYSPLHEMVYHGSELQLKIYLEFIQNFLEKRVFSYLEIHDAINYKNAAGFSLVAQACNNHKANINKLFFDFCKTFYAEEDFMDLLKVNKRYLKCSLDKRDHKELAEILFNYRNMLAQFENYKKAISMQDIPCVDFSILNEAEISNSPPAETYIDLSFLDEEPDGSIKFEFSLTSPQVMERLVEKKTPKKFFDRTSLSPNSVRDCSPNAKAKV